MATFAAALIPMPPTKLIADVPSVFAGRAWQQVLARDRDADGTFVYAVKSTGIYCRPSCASRRPERKNVRFFPTPAAAEAAGFRACLRCEPTLQTPRADPQAEAVTRAAEYLRIHAGERVSLDAAARAAGIGKFAVLRGFKRVLGVTPGEYLRAQRQENFRTRVRRTKSPSITAAVYEAGFGSPSRVYQNADAALGMSPTAMRAGGAGERIAYTVAASPLGDMVVAATERGLCAVLFLEQYGAAEAADADTVVHSVAASRAHADANAALALRERFPQAVLRRDDAALGEAVRFVLGALEETSTAAAMPFHVRATAFQQRVWTALRAIPRGQTRTYAQIAESIGAPRSVRAVGAACGANPLAVVVPCHRVVGSSGALTGYRWGTARKRRLLELEGRKK